MGRKESHRYKKQKHHTTGKCSGLYQILGNCPVMMPNVIGYFTQKQFEEVLESASGNMLHQCHINAMRKFTNCLLHLFPGYRISTDRHCFSDAFISSSGFHRLHFPL